MLKTSPFHTYPIQPNSAYSTTVLQTATSILLQTSSLLMTQNIWFINGWAIYGNFMMSQIFLTVRDECMTRLQRYIDGESECLKAINIASPWEEIISLISYSWFLFHKFHLGFSVSFHKGKNWAKILQTNLARPRGAAPMVRLTGKKSKFPDQHPKKTVKKGEKMCCGI